MLSSDSWKLIAKLACSQRSCAVCTVSKHAPRDAAEIVWLLSVLLVVQSRGLGLDFAHHCFPSTIQFIFHQVTDRIRYVTIPRLPHLVSVCLSTWVWLFPWFPTPNRALPAPLPCQDIGKLFCRAGATVRVQCSQHIELVHACTT